MFRKVLVIKRIAVGKQFYSSKRNGVNFDIEEMKPKEIMNVEDRKKIVKNNEVTPIEIPIKPFYKFNIKPEVKQSKEDGVIKRIAFFTLKCAIAGGVIYGSNEIGIWGPAQESAVLITNIEEFIIQNSMKFTELFNSKNWFYVRFV